MQNDVHRVRRRQQSAMYNQVIILASTFICLIVTWSVLFISQYFPGRSNLDRRVVVSETSMIVRSLPETDENSAPKKQNAGANT